MDMKTLIHFLVTCMIFLALIGSTDAVSTRNNRHMVRSPDLAKSRDNLPVHQRNAVKMGRHKFVGRAIVESIKQRRKQ
jgi:hypothetical protein